MEPVYATKRDLERLLREAEQAHGEYERSLGHRDESWPAWYADFIFQRLPREAEPSAEPYIAG
jgi:hypothetical protein